MKSTHSTNSQRYPLHTAAFIDKIRRHEFIARGPRERYSGTVTAAHEQGWQDQLEVNRQVRDTDVRRDKNNSLTVLCVRYVCDSNHRADLKNSLLAQARPSVTYVHMYHVSCILYPVYPLELQGENGDENMCRLQHCLHEA